jgi:hypothetical protein
VVISVGFKQKKDGFFFLGCPFWIGFSGKSWDNHGIIMGLIRILGNYVSVSVSSWASLSRHG